MSGLGDALRDEAAASRDTVRDLTAARTAFREVLRAHNRMSAGRPFWGSCTCGEWVGPNTKFNDHVADALIDTVS